MSRAGLDADLAGIASLAEPTRRALYLHVQAQEAAVSRDEAAAAVGVPRHTAKFHLDRLAADGLLEVEFARRSGRRGPGAGRPAKLYRRASRDVALTLPRRRYELAGQLMAGAIAEARDRGVPVTTALDEAARAHGRVLAGRVGGTAGDDPSDAALRTAVRQVLDDEGYETHDEPAGFVLANCPFRALAAEHTSTICAMNMAIMQGLLGGLDGLRLTPVLDPAQGRCCVRLAADDDSDG